MFIRRSILKKILEHIGMDFNCDEDRVYSISSSYEAKNIDIRIRRIELKLDMLFSHLGIEYQENCKEILPKIIKKNK